MTDGRGAGPGPMPAVRTGPRRSRDLVVVTGLPRSGTTPVGDALARGARIAQLYEPLNAKAGDKRLTTYFPVPGADVSHADFAQLVEDVQRLRLDLKPGIWKVDGTTRRLVKRVIGGRSRHTFRMARLTGARTLIWKDPFALFTLDDLLTLGHERIVVTFRKPAAIASSFERLGWGFDVADLESRLRVAGVPVPHVPDFDTTGSRHVDSALRLYLLGYGYALDVSRRHPGVLLVDNGDLARDADRLVGALRSRLGLPARPPSRTSRSGAVPTPRPGKAYGKRAHAAHRDLTQVNSYYSEILTAEQVSRIEALTDDLHSALSAAAFRP